MQGLPGPQLGDGRLPIFVFPSALTFYSDDQSSHKQVLTLYNPYDYALKFKVLSTTPKKYTVVDSEGTIRPQCCVDIVIRYLDIRINNEGVKDKFRIQMSEHGKKKILGSKDITSVLLPHREAVSQCDDDFKSLPKQMSLPAEGQSVAAKHGQVHTSASGPGFLVIFTAVACIIALMLPTHGELESKLPDYFHLSLQQKLIAAYILGLVTMVILKV
ncbi:motile sperm domain-containing protein 1-like [Gigantopelta aegis]|uniref:motile sperm domain-containing protein 1-like n=1 Tax=Gigantopelta aegis TaxID=1735272 RepID=UPI001B88BACD|nr:motile sperm domain-containing protein 1-like [Gigantopelta aegis]